MGLLLCELRARYQEHETRYSSHSLRWTASRVLRWYRTSSVIRD